METGFVFFTIIVLAVAFTIFHGNNPPIQLPGQRTTHLPGKINTLPELPGLTPGPGLPQKDYK